MKITKRLTVANVCNTVFGANVPDRSARRERPEQSNETLLETSDDGNKRLVMKVGVWSYNPVNTSCAAQAHNTILGQRYNEDKGVWDQISSRSYDTAEDAWGETLEVIKHAWHAMKARREIGDYFDSANEPSRMRSQASKVRLFAGAGVLSLASIVTGFIGLEAGSAINNGAGAAQTEDPYYSRYGNRAAYAGGLVGSSLPISGLALATRDKKRPSRQ